VVIQIFFYFLILRVIALDLNNLIVCCLIDLAKGFKFCNVVNVCTVVEYFFKTIFSIFYFFIFDINTLKKY